MPARALLFIGGCRSGKSALAQRWAEACGPRRAYVATCIVQDAEMAARVARHQAARGEGWTTLEADGSLAQAMSAAAALHPDAIVLDCVTLWLSSMFARAMTPDAMHTQAAQLAAFLRRPPCPIAVVSNELGMGMVPMEPLSRAFRDMAGEIHQTLAAACDTVLFVTCGLPLVLKGSLPHELRP
ncbi:MAG: bifunctional adenosylcobinamide kinase/adenosylcobinamide-phosphate guanylyltransferase [Desulfovibrionaceae bacterium]|nr:bifunctional adenosylcobinamide kinase/adenosylcobinamide-phosphate guanylyltransferase [Desulfovibrionaceae bacterium]